VPTVEEVIKRLQRNGSQHVAVAIWCEDDVLERAAERGMTISREQAQGVITNIDYRQDCELGITWTTIDCVLDEIAAETD